jgi:hypothetical protein
MEKQVIENFGIVSILQKNKSNLQNIITVFSLYVVTISFLNTYKPNDPVADKFFFNLLIGKDVQGYTEKIREISSSSCLLDGKI